MSLKSTNQPGPTTHHSTQSLAFRVLLKLVHNKTEKKEREGKMKKKAIKSFAFAAAAFALFPLFSLFVFVG
jgi:hypothetical protein